MTRYTARFDDRHAMRRAMFKAISELSVDIQTIDGPTINFRLRGRDANVYLGVDPRERPVTLDSVTKALVIED